MEERRLSVDINQWQLEYFGQTFDFGLFDSGAGDFPLKVQVSISEPTRQTQDNPQPSVDGVIMGYDRLGGMTLTFSCTALPEYPEPVDTWTSPLDKFRAFNKMWRADSIRKSPGSTATLRNLERGVEVYGRPRRCAPTYEQIRKGGTDWIADFVTVDPNFYATALHIIDLEGEGEDDEFVFDNGGDLDTWPIIYLAGGSNIQLTFDAVDDSLTPWTVECLSDSQNYPVAEFPDEPYDGISSADNNMPIPILIDTRPWARGILTMKSSDGTRDPEQGVLLSGGIDDMAFPVKDGLRFTLSSQDSDLVKARIFWREAYAGL